MDGIVVVDLVLRTPAAAEHVGRPLSVPRL